MSGSSRGEDDPDVDPPEHEEGFGELFDELERLAALVDDPEERQQVHAAMEAASDAEESPVFGQVIWGFDRADVAEATLGALLFGIPMAVEGGTGEAGQYLATNPIPFVGTILATVALSIGIIYVAEIQDVRVHDPLFGFLPRRLVGVLGISLLTAAVLLTGWNRVEWGDPLVATATVVVATFPMSIGAALGDILPGT